IELKDRANGGEGEAVLRLRSHPLPGLTLAPPMGPQTLEGIDQQRQVEARQPVVGPCREVLVGEEDLWGQPAALLPRGPEPVYSRAALIRITAGGPPTGPRCLTLHRFSSPFPWLWRSALLTANAPGRVDCRARALFVQASAGVRVPSCECGPQ